MANIQVCSLNSILYLCVNCLSLVYVIFNLSNTVKQQLLESFLQEVRVVATIQVCIFHKLIVTAQPQPQPQPQSNTTKKFGVKE